MNHLTHTLHRFLNAIASNDRSEELCYLFIALLKDVLMVKPYALLIIKACSCLRAFCYVELLYEFVEGEHLLLCARVPSQQCKEIEHSLGEVTLLAETIAYLTRLGVMPLEREYREAKAVAISFREFSLAVWF